jgi:ABC-type Na+ efflux pump permease subunit
VDFVFTSAVKDLRRRLRDPASLAIWFGIPLLLGGLLTLAVGGREGPKPRARILLADEDDSAVSRLLAGGFGGLGDTTGPISVERVDRREGRVRIDAGEATALLIIPEGFGRAILEDTPMTLELVTNPAQRILPGIVEEILEMGVEATFYLQRLVGDPARDALEEPSRSSVSALSAEVYDRARRLEGSLFPPAIRLRTRTEQTGEPSSPPFGLLFLPGLLFMALMFVAQGMSDDVWEERRFGTLRRALATPRGAASSEASSSRGSR